MWAAAAEWVSVYIHLSAFVALQLSPGSEDDDGEGPISEKLGRIQFSIGYSFQNTTLTVKVLKGQELPAKDFSGTSDPFVKIYLLPDKKHKLETKVKRKNLNPHWNETFLFEGLSFFHLSQKKTVAGVSVHIDMTLEKHKLLCLSFQNRTFKRHLICLLKVRFMLVRPKIEAF